MQPYVEKKLKPVRATYMHYTILRKLRSVLVVFFSCFEGDFGGLLGLFLGGSFISILEVVDLVVYNLLLKSALMLRSLDRQQSAKVHPRNDEDKDHVMDSPGGRKSGFQDETNHAAEENAAHEMDDDGVRGDGGHSKAVTAVNPIGLVLYE